jgi:3-oxoacyl-[acyl-carrier protein] reductase
MRYNDRVVLVTGASRGIGREIAIGFASEGANVVINYSKSKEDAKRLEQLISSKDNKCMAIQADVTDIGSVKNMFTRIIEVYGKIDVLINNAGIYEDSVVWKMKEEVWKNVIETDLTSVFNCTKFAVSNMRDQSYGRVLSISSVVGQTGAFGTSNYSAAKAGILGFTKAVAKEVARKNITVNAVALGFLEIGMLLRLPSDVQNAILKQIPMGRWGRPEELVATLLFLASEEASYITGQTINVNGGYHV